MKLQPITKCEGGYPAGQCVIVCCVENCREEWKGVVIRTQEYWHKAAEDGWHYDREGKPYQSYYCPKCVERLKK